MTAQALPAWNCRECQSCLFRCHMSTRTQYAGTPHVLFSAQCWCCELLVVDPWHLMALTDQLQYERFESGVLRCSRGPLALLMILISGCDLGTEISQNGPMLINLFLNSRLSRCISLIFPQLPKNASANCLTKPIPCHPRIAAEAQTLGILARILSTTALG